MQTYKKKSIGIIGLGAIAFGYDQDKSDLVLTYSRAISEHPNFNFGWGIDPSEEKRQQFSDKYQTQSFQNIEQATSNIDAVVIASPTAHHFESVKQALKLNPKVIVLEKPMAPSLEQAQAITQLCEQQGIPLYVNYQRRLEPAFSQIKKRFLSGEFGKLVSAQLNYSRGLLNNASHFFDLTHYLFNDDVSCSVLHSHQCKNNPDNYSGLLLMNNTPFVFHGVELGTGGTIDLELFFSEARVNILDFGRQIEIKKLLPDPVFTSFKTYQSHGEKLSSAYKSSMQNLLSHIHDVIEGKTKPVSNGTTAIQSQKLCEQIRQKSTSV